MSSNPSIRHFFLNSSISKIKKLNKKVGVSLNPETKVEVIKEHLNEIDLVLIMSVNPGFGGQSFIPGTLDKLREVRSRIDASDQNIRLEVDGGVKVDNIAAIAAAGADMFVAGSAIFNQPDYAAVIQQMRDELATVSSK